MFYSGVEIFSINILRNNLYFRSNDSLYMLWICHMCIQALMTRSIKHSELFPFRNTDPSGLLEKGNMIIFFIAMDML